MPLSLINPFTLRNVFLELAVSEHCTILRLNVQPAKTSKWHTTVQNVCICVCEGDFPVLGAGLWERPFTCLDTRTLPLSKNYFQTKGERLPGILVVISCLNNLPMSCWNAKKTSFKTTNVSYLFPFGASQQKQNNIIRTYVEFLKASNSSISGCEVKAYFPIPFMKKGFECSPPVFNSVAQFSSCLPFFTVCREVDVHT